MLMTRRSDCQGEDFYDIDTTLADFKRPAIYNLGMMNCYCSQMYESYGKAALKMLFYDNEQYCKTWFDSFEQSKYTGIGVGCWIAFMNIVMTVSFQWLGKIYRAGSTFKN